MIFQVKNQLKIIKVFEHFFLPVKHRVPNIRKHASYNLPEEVMTQIKFYSCLVDRRL